MASEPHTVAQSARPRQPQAQSLPPPLTTAAARQVERQVASKGVLTAEDQAVLLDAYRLLWRLQCGTKLLTDRPLDLETLGEGGRAFLLRETGETSAPALSDRLDRAVFLAETVIASQFLPEG